MLRNEENVARAIFSPRMIYNGELQTEAFQLRESIREEYLSVMRMAVDSWLSDIYLIPQRKSRTLYGYAEMNVGDIRKASFLNVIYDVKPCSNNIMKSHAGIFITVNDEPLQGGTRLESIDAASQDFLLLLIQRRLVDIARRKLSVLSTPLQTMKQE